MREDPNLEAECQVTFKNHEVTVVQLPNELVGNVSILRFKKPDTICHMIDYIIIGNTLFIKGDYGCAAYRWSQQISFEWVAGCNFSYFYEKQEASFNGVRNHDWNSDLACEHINEHFKEDADQEEPYRALKPENLETCLEHTESKFEWHHFLSDKGYKIFGDSWYEFAPQFGAKPQLNAQIHLYALRIAVKKLEAQSPNLEIITK